MLVLAKKTLIKKNRPVQTCILTRGYIPCQGEKEQRKRQFLYAAGRNKKITDDRLERIKEEYLKPVIINNILGEFRLNRSYNRFEGQIYYLGEKCNVYLNVEEGSAAADIQLNKLSSIFGDLADWDSSVRKFVSSELVELANEWREEDEAGITEEQFIQRIGAPDITIDTNGAVKLYFNSDNMFTDHSIEVNIGENGNFLSTDIVG